MWAGLLIIFSISVEDKVDALFEMLAACGQLGRGLLSVGCYECKSRQCLVRGLVCGKIEAVSMPMLDRVVY